MQNQHGPFFSDHATAPQSLPSPSSPTRRLSVAAASGFSNPPTKADWAKVQLLVRDLYVVQNKPLKIIEETLKGIRFRAR